MPKLGTVRKKYDINNIIVTLLPTAVTSLVYMGSLVSFVKDGGCWRGKRALKDAGSKLSTGQDETVKWSQ